MCLWLGWKRLLIVDAFIKELEQGLLIWNPLDCLSLLGNYKLFTKLLVIGVELDCFCDVLDG